MLIAIAVALAALATIYWVVYRVYCTMNAPVDSVDRQRLTSTTLMAVFGVYGLAVALIASDLVQSGLLGVIVMMIVVGAAVAYVRKNPGNYPILLQRSAGVKRLVY